MRSELYINGVDAYTSWGIILDSSSLSALMTPPENKEFLSNESPLKHGTEYLVPEQIYFKERELNLTLTIVAPSRSVFLARFDSFAAQLATGKLDISTKYQSGVTYKTIYKSCRQFKEFNGKIGKFTLSLIEPNPFDR